MQTCLNAFLPPVLHYLRCLFACVHAIIAATYRTALRTATVDAAAVACEDAQVLALVGTGHQAYYDALVSHVRDLRRILVCDRRGDAARVPLIAGGLLGPDTHLSVMGADGPGKHELAIKIVATASLCAAAPQQVMMGIPACGRCGSDQNVFDRRNWKSDTGTMSGRVGDGVTISTVPALPCRLSAPLHWNVRALLASLPKSISDERPPCFSTWMVPHERFWSASRIARPN